MNIARVAIEALAGVLGGTQSLHTDAYDEALALPTENAARIALRTQQVIAHETGTAHVADPLGGSWFVESLTEEIERRAEELFDHIAELGSGSMLDGVVEGIELRLVPGRDRQRGRTSSSARSTAATGCFVGVSDFTESDGGEPPLLYIDPAVETRQLARLQQVKAERDDAAVSEALARVEPRGCRPDGEPVS